MMKIFNGLIVLCLMAGLALPGAQPAAAQASVPVTFTILHTNDFHGQLVAVGSNPGMARVATVVNGVRAAVGEANVLLLDAGDEMQGSLLSNLQKGLPVIETFNAMGYDAATFGNHEFDWGRETLIDRVGEADYPYLSANIVAGACDAANWTPPAFAQPYVILTAGTAPNTVRVAVTGVTTQETPTITIAEATEGLCFKDPEESILHYYDAMDAASDVIVVLSHLGLEDGGYGYGLPAYGDKSLATRLIKAGKPANLIIGGHNHIDMSAAAVVTVEGKAGSTTVAQAHYNGRKLGRADITFTPATNGVSVTWSRLVISTSGAVDAAISDLINQYANDPVYLAKVNTPVGYSAVDLARLGGLEDNMMATFVDDAIYKYLNTDGVAENDIDLFFNNAGGIRTDWCYDGVSKWLGTGCKPGLHDPALLNYGDMFTILPFGNATAVGQMTGAQILQVLNQAPLSSNGLIQVAGLRYKYYAYRDAKPGPQPYAWGAFDACVVNQDSGVCEALEMTRTYRVGTNEFLAPAGQDGYTAFKYMTHISYWGDMLNAVNAYVAATYGTPESAYRGPNGDGALDGRILRDGSDMPDSGSIVPITVLHHNDSHGNLAAGTYAGYTQLAALIKQEKAHNPRTLLLSSGDNIQGDSMMYYFKSAPLGYAADGTVLPAALQTHPMMAVMNAMGYDAYTLGNHEFNFGSQIFRAVLGQAQFPVLQANVSDDGTYGLAEAGADGVQPYVLKDVGGIKVAILGIGNHRVPNYELPSNIPGLTFSDPIAKAQELSDALRASNDVVLALTHIGFTENLASVEVDANVDTNLAAQVSGIDAIIGGHSHTNPLSGFGGYKFLPTIVGGPGNTPVLINQAYRYNNTLGEVVIGVRPKAGGGYEVASRAGRAISVPTSTVADPQIKGIVDPYAAQLLAYNNTVVGLTTAPIDALKAFTQETTGANLQADAAVYELARNEIAVDFHLSGAMTNKAVAQGATPESPVTLKVSDMFSVMPYENSLVVLDMNGPQLKAVLERAYRNYYYYNYVPDYGGYSYYTTCMIDINAGGQITYNDLYPAAYDPNQSYVVSLVVDGEEIDFNDAERYYRVSTVNYLAAGSCNFNNGGASLWPLDQIAYDTQFYVRDAVINTITAMGTVSPAIEGRLKFITDTQAPAITIHAPAATSYLHPDRLTLDFTAADQEGLAGLARVWADLEGAPVSSGQVIDLYSLALGSHTLTVYAVDKAGNLASLPVTFDVIATLYSLSAGVERLYTEGAIAPQGLQTSLLAKLAAAQSQLDKEKQKPALQMLEAFISEVSAQSGKGITAAAADLLISDAIWVIARLK